MCAGFSVQDVSVVHLAYGSDCREEGNHQMLVSNRRWQARMLEQLFLSGLLWCSLQWQMTDGLMLPWPGLHLGTSVSAH